MSGVLLAISDRRSLGPLSLEAWADAIAAAGVDRLQLREKDLPDRAVFHLATTLRRLLAGTGCRLLVNGRADLAHASGADGVHLPAAEVAPARLAGRWPGLLIGRSTHTIDDVRRAADEGADYVTFGPIFPTRGRGKADPQGLPALAKAASCGVPVLALGGIDCEEIAAVAATGAAGIAGIRLFRDPRRLGEVVTAAREAFSS